MRVTETKWFLPLFCVALGALVLFGGRSETIRGLRGDGRDERFRAIDMRATAISGLAAIVVFRVRG